MAVHNTLGKEGEDLASLYLAEKGYAILHRNWRHSHYEIDIIATKGPWLHFIEVKTRSSKTYGLPETGVTKRKFGRLLLAADEFLHLHPQYRHVQYDILAINQFKNETSYFLIEDVYLY
jgi:putative endonuclease